MSSFKRRSDYFKNIAYMSKLIAHNRPVTEGSTKLRNSFHRINSQDEFDASIVNWGHYPCVVHMGHDLVFKQTGSGLPRRVTQNALRFLAKANKAMYKYEADAIEASYDIAADAMFQFIAYMINDSENTDPCCAQIFDLNRANAQQTEQVYDGVYGWDLFFDDENKEKGFIYKPLDWYDGNGSIDNDDCGCSGNDNGGNDNGSGTGIITAVESEIIPFSAEETIKIIELTEERKKKFGTAPKVQYWYFEGSAPRENVNISITADALPPNMNNLYVDLNAPGPGVLILSR